MNFINLTGDVQLCNGFIQFEQNFLQNLKKNRKVQQEHKSQTTYLFLWSMICLLTFTGVFGPIVYCLDIFQNPCFPSYVGHSLISQWEDNVPGYYALPIWNVKEVLVKMWISVCTYVIWSSLLPGGLFQMSLEYLVRGHCILVNNKEFGREYLILKAN